MKEELKESLTELKGVGPKKFQLFQKVGIFSMEDALYSFPREYEDRRNIKKIAAVLNDERCMVEARIKRVTKGRYVRGKKQTIHVTVEDDTGEMSLIFFNAAYLARSMKIGDLYWFFGKMSVKQGKREMVHPMFGLVDEESYSKKILPLYPLTKGLSQKERRRVVTQLLTYVDEGLECLSETTREKYQLCGISYALNNIHFPLDGHKMRAAKYRLIFEELLYFSLGLGLMKNRLSQKESCYVMSRTSFENELCEALPYELTEGQKKTIEEICCDMESGKRLNRLIQGDVGSGKTVVSAAAIYKTVKNGYQAALMAPTEILARQHYETFKELFAGKNIDIQLLTSSVPTRKRLEILKKVSEKETMLLIGTHAVFGRDVKFKELALVVTDEQHRFGVSQREALNAKGRSPHILVMTATPIPRTLALVLYGDMDVSVIRDKPEGRKPIITRAARADERKKVYNFVLSEIKKGRQAYIVAPLIEASDNPELRSSEEIYEEASKFFAPFETALLHGRMKANEKADIMERFKNGEIKVLVATVIIEVGINVPNATVMIIENSERFGLAQMHQLRGRVGRGSEQSYCMLISGSESEVALQRAEAMEKYSDGLIIAEKDLELRGTGEFFGVRQHGVPDMRIADVIRHSRILRQAAAEAQRIMQDDPLLEAEKNQRLKERVFELYGELRPGL